MSTSFFELVVRLLSVSYGLNFSPFYKTDIIMIFGFYNSLNIKTHLNIKDISIGNTYHHPIFITYCILNEIKKMKNNCKIISLLPVAMLTLKLYCLFGYTYAF